MKREATNDRPPSRLWAIPLSLRIFVAILVSLGVASAFSIYRRRTTLVEIDRIGGCFCDVQAVGPQWLRRITAVDNGYHHKVGGLDTIEYVGFMPDKETFFS